MLNLVGGLVSSMGTFIFTLLLVLIFSPDYAFSVYYCPGCSYFYFVTPDTFPWIIFALNNINGQITLGMLFVLFVALSLVKDAFNWIIASYGSIVDLESMKKTALMPATAMMVETMVLMAAAGGGGI